MRLISLIALIFIILLGITFAALNSKIVTFNYYVGQANLPLSIILAGMFVFGGLMGVLVGSWMLLKSKYTIYRLKQKLKVSEKEIENLRAIPIREKDTYDI